MTTMILIHEIVTFLRNMAVLILKIFYHTLESVYITFLNLFLPEKSVSKEIVLITGAGHGIGKELALQYAALGATVVCLDKNQQTNNETADEIRKTIGDTVHAYQCDITNVQQIFKVAEKVKEEVGDVTILVNNAGIMPAHPFLNQTIDLLKAQIDINILSHFLTLKAFLPSMIEKNYGHVVALSSLAGITALRNLVPYCATKFAVRGLMETLREELRLISKGKSMIKFTTIFPYMVDTGLCKKPKIKYPNLMPLQSPKYVAKQIIKAQRKDIEEMSVPSYWLPFITMMRNLPSSIYTETSDFFNAYVDAEE